MYLSVRYGTKIMCNRFADGCVCFFTRGGDGGQVPTVMTARVRASTVMRTFEERVILQAYQQQTVVLELQVRAYCTSTRSLRFQTHTHIPSHMHACACMCVCECSLPRLLYFLVSSLWLVCSKKNLGPIVPCPPGVTFPPLRRGSALVHKL